MRVQPTQVWRDAGSRLKIEPGYGIMDIFEKGCAMKLQQRDWDKLHFEGKIPDKTVTITIIEG